ncbi:Meprin A subunit beta [Labeo rohita]|uniref:Metalloendopeptidase n=1 Tax=Labeo rohita TaxID=84645 RepID=A0ABQ8LZ57_LABRO|nr:Meprin A subunit beta [Labeo rohita]
MYCELNSLVVLGLNLREGDIMMPNQRSAILGNQYRWNISVPYELNVDLTFEQFRLKSCIDFKPRTAEDISYISVESREGCWSYVGRTSPGAQTLSIGIGCGTKGIVEHEFLHALGFWHEQSRYDRDDYVTINFTNIITGKKSNFNKYNKNISTTQDTPYDYYSVMHYNKNAFSNGNGSTIITKRPELQDVTGQRLDMSEYDVIELNKCYKCNSSVSFLDHCSFDDDSLCQMSVCSAADYGWKRVTSVSGISVTDHTYLGKEQNGEICYSQSVDKSVSFDSVCFVTEGDFRGRLSSSTSALRGGIKGDARMESKTMTPKRDCKVQCLQFYYYHSGHESDQLNIWIREYQNETDSKGTLRLMDQITARKGAGNSSGGFSLDDINISETECPHTWQIRDFEKIMNNSVFGTVMYSPLYYSSDGYRFQAGLVVYQNYLLIYVRLVSGVYDDQLQWPCPWRQITVQMFDQNPHIQKRMSSEKSITTNPALASSNVSYYWDNPRKGGNQVIISNESVFVGTWTHSYNVRRDDLTGREFIKGGDIIFCFSIQDISGLLQNHSLPCPKVTVKNFNVTSDASAQQESCAPRLFPTPQMTSTTTTKTTTTTAATTTRTITGTPTTPGTTKGVLPTPQITSTTKTTTRGTTEGECVDIFCNSSAKTASSLIILVPPQDKVGINGEWKGIPDINRGLNLREGDIMMLNQTNAISGNQYRWNITIPYELSVNLSLNYKGVIFRAFEQFRLKSCIDFKPRAAEDISYISVESREGCWSYVGRTSPGAQTLSIGNGCGFKAIVEHEFLHALGFWHEQSRYDRDDYVTINFTNIITGYEHNFDKYSENVTTTGGTPYDYYSVMHYDKNAFSNGNGSTIITKRPEFQNVIGQHLDMSEYDVMKLNKLYKCSKYFTQSFLLWHIYKGSRESAGTT